MRTLWLAAVLVALGIVISIDVIPGAFNIDDNNYLVNVLALQHGRVTVANTEGLSPSRELLFFDPSASSHAVPSTPVGSTAPPLYALVALPFSWFGWRGLVALNTLSYLATILLVFQYADRHSTNPSTAWLAAGAFALGGYAIEYTLGVWPHALSFALCTAGIAAAGRAIEGDRVRFAAAAGVLLALAAGVRYQNVVILGAAGGGIVLWASASRLKALAAFSAAAIVPLSTSAALNHARFGLWNPISKGPGYLDVPSSSGGAGSLLHDTAVVFWARLVDFSAYPPMIGPYFEGWVRNDPATGAHLIMDAVVKKAFLQSAPWAVLALALFVLAWLPGFHLPEPRRRQLRLLSLVSFAILMTFALYGFRPDGLAFNERYLLEILPLAAIAFAWALEDCGLRPVALGIGAALAGIVVVTLVLMMPVGGVHGRLLELCLRVFLKGPLALAGALALVWLLDRAGVRRRMLLSGLVGACLGWGLTVHLSGDVLASQSVRATSLKRTEALASVLTDRSALVTYAANKQAVPAGPLLFNRDIVIVQTEVDDGKDAPVLIRELLASGRRVFVLEDGFSAETYQHVVAGLRVTPVETRTLPLSELTLDPK